MTAASNDTRVRVDGFSKIRAICLPVNRSLQLVGSAFTASAWSRMLVSSVAVRSSIDRKSRSTGWLALASEVRFERRAQRGHDAVSHCGCVGVGEGTV